MKVVGKPRGFLYQGSCVTIQVMSMSLTIATLGGTIAFWFTGRVPQTMPSYFPYINLTRQTQPDPQQHSDVSSVDKLLQIDTNFPARDVAVISRSEANIISLAQRRQQVRKHRYLTDAQLLQDAVDVGSPALPLASPPITGRMSTGQAAAPRIAFLFLVRGPIPFEQLWRRFFAGHESRYSLYVHAQPGYTYPETSLFFQKELIQSKTVQRMSRSLVDAVRRLLAVALLDPDVQNAWFINVCEATIPIRSFIFVYDYIARSHHSFVQAFLPVDRYLGWDTRPTFELRELRKGEVWMTLQRRHALAIVDDHAVYAKFVAECGPWCTFDEEYFQTLLHLQDPGGIANRTVMFVDWSDPAHGSAPRLFDSKSTTAQLLLKIAFMTQDSLHGAHHDTAANNATVVCTHNGVPGASCFLFARKFHPSSLSPLQSLEQSKVLDF